MDYFRSPEQRRKHGHEQAAKHLEKQYNGGHGLSDWKVYRRPLAANADDDRRRLGLYYINNTDEEHGRQTFLNPDFENVKKYADLDTYYSDTKAKPRRLIVQATRDVIRQDKLNHGGDVGRNWGYREIRARVPVIIKLAELCLNPLGDAHYDGTESEEKYDHDHEKRLTRTVAKKALPIWKAILHWTLSTIFTICFAWIILVMMALQVITAPWTNADDTESYDDFGNVDWHWPKHALNPLDQAPDNHTVQSGEAYLNLPRKLVVQDEKEPSKWATRETKDIRHPLTGELAPYIFLSYTSASFPQWAGKEGHEQLREYLHHVAKRMVEKENEERREGQPKVRAFWLDADCISNENKEEKDKDVYSISDAVRGARRVYIVLRNGSATEKRTFGQRVWTLPEALLAAGKTRFCVPSTLSEGEFDLCDTSLTDMYGSFWYSHQTSHETDGSNSVVEWAGIKQDEAMSMLIKHYSNTIKLSDLQLFSYAVQALADGITSRDGPGSAVDVGGYTNSYLAYAAMGLLSYRINPLKANEPENNFQAIARLSMVNDTDHLLERLVCMWPAGIQEENHFELPNAAAGTNKILGNIAKRDQYRTHLWDIKPVCQVVGVGDDADAPTVVLDRCHAIPIRWKSFPTVRYSKNFRGFRNTLAANVVYLGCLMLNVGCWSLWQAVPVSFGVSYGWDSTGVTETETGYKTSSFMQYYLAGAAILFAATWVTSFFSPLAVRQLCNGDGGGYSNHLVGFEGTMSLREIEIAMYGNFNNRLRYAPSSTLFSEKLRDTHSRTARPPRDLDWEEIYRKVPRGHRLFTLVDTGDCTVSLIATERPPVVALVCGREGGMARALLCSWRFDNNCLYREYVMRMRSSVVELSARNDWLKVSLASQGDVNRRRMRLSQTKRADASSIGSASSVPRASSGPGKVAAVRSVQL